MKFFGNLLNHVNDHHYRWEHWPIGITVQYEKNRWESRIYLDGVRIATCSSYEQRPDRQLHQLENYFLRLIAPLEAILSNRPGLKSAGKTRYEHILESLSVQSDSDTIESTEALTHPEHREEERSENQSCSQIPSNSIHE